MKPNGQLLSEIEEDEAQWLWENWLVAGTVNWVIGDPGLGKSTFVYDVVKRVVNDELMPDGSQCLMPGGAVIIELEESLTERTVPRLRATGADLSRIMAIKRVIRKNPPVNAPAEGMFELPTDMGLLRECIDKVGATLVVIDPWLVAVAASVHNWSSQPASNLFMQLHDLAEELGICVIAINHWRRGTKHDKAEDMDGSSQLGKRARMAIGMYPDVTMKGRSFLKQVKVSNGPRVQDIMLRHDGTHVKYLTGLTELEAEHAEKKRRDAASGMIRFTLANNPVRAWHPTELRALCEDVSAGEVREICKSLMRTGEIVDAGRGMVRANISMPKRRRIP